MELQRSNRFASAKILEKQNGFASIVFLTILPALLAGLLFLLFSQYFLKNWMQSLYICRTELLETQKAAGKEIRNLMALNIQAATLRIQLAQAKAELAAATLVVDEIGIARAMAKIANIEKKQFRLDRQQRRIIAQAESRMNQGLQKVARELRSQNTWNQQHIPSSISFRIHSIRPIPKKLAVKPDKSEIAPVYELENDFSAAQALNVSWKSEFQTTSKGMSQWISNHHVKSQSCSASLKESGLFGYQEILKEDKPSWNL